MPDVHAPDGGIVCGSLCEEPGDTTTHEADVSCGDCLDILSELPAGTFTQLAQHTAELRSVL